jgi:cyclopropane-fatty-acyl-phospholipid synthase
LLLRMLDSLDHGVLHLGLPDGRCVQFGNPAATTLPATLLVHDWSVFARVMRDGDIGFAEAYIDAQWTTPDLPGLLTLLARNRETLHAAIYGRWWARLAHRLSHWRNRNSKAGSRRNVHAHYDLGNAFYSGWLDAGMTYSSAWFGGGTEQSLEAAQAAKYQRLLDELAINGRVANVLEVGCGWGAFAERALQAGHRVTGITLSREQLAYASARLKAHEHADIRLVDYRDVDGKFDAIVSIEMFEAVGETWWPGYFGMIKQCLREGGRAAVQTITIKDELFDAYRGSSDFIQQYIFPGGMLPSQRRFEEEARRAGLRVTNRLAFGLDYARTLSIWRERFHQDLDQVHELGFDDRFIRIWNFYLAYCEAGFAAGSTDVVQYTLEHA